MAKVCNYYHVSADFLLGRTSSRDGAMIEPESLYDASDEKGSLKGSIMATLQKKLVVNTTGVLFDLLGKLNSHEAITAAGDYLSSALYQLLRLCYRRCGGNEDLFAVDDAAFDGDLIVADLALNRVRYYRALADCEETPSVNSDTLTGVPGVGQSVAQVLHNVDERTLKRLEG